MSICTLMWPSMLLIRRYLSDPQVIDEFVDSVAVLAVRRGAVRRVASILVTVGQQGWVDGACWLGIWYSRPFLGHETSSSRMGYCV